MKSYSTDVLIIGAGQAGLALAYHLKPTTLLFQLVERQGRVGDNWRKRYDSLTLFTPRPFSALPGLALDGDRDGYASRDEFANYLERYATQFEFPITLNQKIVSLERNGEGFQAVSESGERYLSRIVVLATGPFEKPNIPELAARFPSSVQQFTVESYKNAAQIPMGRVLVVGDGASGRDIAAELVKSHAVVLATGRPRRLLPEKLFGKNIWWWLDKFGLLRVSGNTPIGRFMRQADPFPARGNRLGDLKRRGIEVKPALVAVDGNTVRFKNDETAEVDSVIWATGYRDESDWINIPEIKDAKGNFIHEAGISPVENLYFIGRAWQRARGSALITGVGEDARYLTEVILKREDTPAQEA